MDNILEAIALKHNTKADILTPRLVDKRDIPENQDITSAWERLHNLTNLGTQYEWLGRYAVDYPGIEVCVEAGVGFAHIAVQEHGVIEKTDPISGYRVIPEKSERDTVLVFGNFSFPIIDKKETEMKELIEEWGYEDIMSMTWFCHNPIKGKPCGICHPCYEKINSQMEFLLPDVAIRRNKIDRKWNAFLLYKLYKRVMRKTIWK